jgi:acetamidase/formamidase
VPPAGKIKLGEAVKIECVDWTGGQIGNNDSAEDMKVCFESDPCYGEANNGIQNVDLTKVRCSEC